MTPAPSCAIDGCGAISALGAGVDPIRAAIRQNTVGLRPCPRLADANYQSTVTGWIPEDLRFPASASGAADALACRLALGATEEALRASTVDFQAVAPARRGLVLSTTKGDIVALERIQRGERVSAMSRRHLLPALLADDLAAYFGVQGPVQCVSAACISGLLALQQGARWIERGDADVVLVIGVDLLSHFVLAGFTSLKSLEPDGCRPFDRNRAGLSLGEGAGAVVLRSSGRATSGCWQLTGWGTSNDANHLTGPSRDGAGLALALRRALARAGVAPETVEYLNAHGTGTPYNDAMECLAFRSVFGDSTPPFGSSKAVFGHTLGVAGILETILCLVAAEAQLLPGTPRLQDPDPAAPASLLRTPQPAPNLRCIVKVNCGFAGTNGAIVLQREAPPPPPPPNEP